MGEKNLMYKNNLIRFHNLEQGSEEWLNFRKLKIGSSSAASICGVGFKTPLQLFEDMLEEKVYAPNMAMIRGTFMEPLARNWLNQKYSCDLQPVVVSHPKIEHDWHISSIDGLYERSDGSIFVTEIKCPGRKDHITALEGHVPEKYLPQCLHILEDLPGVDKLLYFSYCGDSQAEVWVERDEKKMAIQFSKELIFYQNLLSCIPPEPTERDWIEFASDDIIEQVSLYKFLQDQIHDLQAQADALKQKVIEKTGLVSRAKIGNLKLQKIIRRGSIDYNRIEALKDMDLNPYRKEPIISWRLS